MALSRQYTEQINDWVRWYNYHIRAAKTAPLETQMKFLLKANEGAYRLLAGLSDELQRISQKELANPAERLILPIGVRW